MRLVGIIGCLWALAGLLEAQTRGVPINGNDGSLNIWKVSWYTIKALSKAMFYGPFLRKI